ncbi:MAG: hypothetical protein JW881_17210 [Spirochaetales bacterium]|nr:hypothetical protein [Spirochaetales bacterium]
MRKATGYGIFFKSFVIKRCRPFFILYDCYKELVHDRELVIESLWYTA